MARKTTVPTLLGTRLWERVCGRCFHTQLLRSYFMMTAYLVCLTSVIYAADAGSPGPRPEQGKAQNILGLYQEKSDTGVRIRIVGDGKLDMAQSRSLYDPPRLVMDFPGVLFPKGPDVYTLSSDAVRKIRISRSDPDKTRIVFDLTGKSGAAHRISQEGTVLSVEFLKRKDEDTKPVAKITEPRGSITVQAGRKISFSGSVTGGNEPIRSEWTYDGNGIRFTSLKPESFRFEQPGLYEITFRATDSDGDTATDTVTVRVQDASGEILPAGSSPHGQAVDQAHRGFGISAGAGIYHAGSLDDFTIEYRGDAGNETWSLSSGDRYMLTLGAFYRFTNWFDLSANLSGVPGDADIDLFFGSAGPRIMLPTARGFKPYLRTAITYGHLRWDDAPGDFDDAMGWDFGYGITWASSDWNIGADLAFRNIEFDYTEPAAGNASASREKIDFSGYALYLSCSYLF